MHRIMPWQLLNLNLNLSLIIYATTGAKVKHFLEQVLPQA